jgi:hypothetical protein
MGQMLKHRWLGVAAFAGSFLSLAAAASASATYDIAPVTSGVTGELTSNLPVILGVIGALIALAIAIRAVRKFVKV